MESDELPPELRPTEQRVRAALAAEARGLRQTMLRPAAQTSAPRVHRRRALLGVAAAIVLLGGVVTTLTVADGRLDRGLADLTGTTAPSSAPATVTGSSMSCAYDTVRQPAQEAARQGGGLVVGVLRARRGASGGPGTSPVTVTITEVLAGRLPDGTVDGWIPGSSPEARTTSPVPGTTAALDQEGSAGWATDGAFLGLLHPLSDGSFVVDPTPLVGGRAVVGLGCWSGGDLPTTRETTPFVVAGDPPVTVSAPVDLVAVSDIRASLR